jgi:hypothetical protein
VIDGSASAAVANNNRRIVFPPFVSWFGGAAGGISGAPNIRPLALVRER